MERKPPLPAFLISYKQRRYIPSYTYLNLYVSVSTSQNLSILGRKKFIFNIIRQVNLLPFPLRPRLALCRNVLELMQFCIWDFLLDVDSLSVFDHFSFFLLQIPTFGTFYEAFLLRFSIKAVVYTCPLKMRFAHAFVLVH